MNKLFTILIALTALVAYASDVTIGNALKRTEFRTRNNMTFYIDPTGSDSNACTASGAAACLSINGVMNKLPPNIHHLVQVEVAAGSYASAGVSSITGFTIYDGGVIDIRGTSTFAAAAPITTGSTSGSLTVVDNTETLAPPVMTDGAQTWTVDELKGFFLEMTSGAASGQRRVITANTATALTLGSAFGSAPSAGNTYNITMPAVSMGSLRVDRIEAFNATVGTLGHVHLRNITFAPTTGAACTTSAINGGLGLENIRCISTSTSLALSFSTGTLLMLGGYYYSPSGIAASMSNYLAWTTANGTTYGRPYLRGGASSGASGAVIISTSRTGGSAGFTAENTSATGNVVIVANGGTFGTSNNGAATFMYLRCASGSSGIALNASTSSGTTAYAFLQYGQVSNCATGIAARGPGSVITWGGQAFLNVTRAVDLYYGATWRTSGVTSTFTGVTSEVALDNEVFTFATVATSFPGIMNLATGTAAIHGS